MSTVYADTIKPRDTGLDITLGIAGDTTVISADSINANTVKDSGGNTLWTSDGSGNLSSVSGGLKGNLVLLSTQSGTDLVSIEFTSGIDSTYDVYIFKFNALNPATDAMAFRFQVNTVGESGYNETVTDSIFRALHKEDDTTASLSYTSGEDQGQGTSPIIIMRNIGNGADECGVGELYLFAPSSTIYVKQFLATTAFYDNDSAIQSDYIGGYINVTAAVDAIQFTFASGNFDGEIKMYGLL